MKTLLVLAILLSVPVVQAAGKIKMNFTNEELIKIVQMYSKESGQKFIVDPSVRGKVSIFQQEPVTVEEAFNQLSSALAVNGFAISKQGDTMVIKSARNIQRDMIEVSSERPGIKPERMYTWIYTPKNVQVDNINRELRILCSKDGEMSVNVGSNQLIITDWVSNINRVADLMKEIDKPVDPATAKMVEAAKKERELAKKESTSKKQE
jgi:general secretion pathway protein D